MGHLYNPAFDGIVKRYACQCGFVTKEGERAVWWGGTRAPEAEKPRGRNYCLDHARETAELRKAGTKN